MAFERYYNAHVNEYFTEQSHEDLYIFIMNAAPDQVEGVKGKMMANIKANPNLAHTTYYRIAKKALAIKEKLESDRTEECDAIIESSQPVYQPTMLDDVRPFKRGSFLDSLSTWYVQNRLADQFGRGLANMFSTPVDYEGINRRAGQNYFGLK